MNNYITIKHQQKPCVKCFYIGVTERTSKKEAYCRDSKALVSAVRGTCDNFLRKNNNKFNTDASDCHCRGNKTCIFCGADMNKLNTSAG